MANQTCYLVSLNYRVYFMQNLMWKVLDLWSWRVVEPGGSRLLWGPHTLRIGYVPLISLEPQSCNLPGNHILLRVSYLHLLSPPQKQTLREDHATSTRQKNKMTWVCVRCGNVNQNYQNWVSTPKSAAVDDQEFFRIFLSVFCFFVGIITKFEMTFFEKKTKVEFLNLPRDLAQSS